MIVEPYVDELPAALAARPNVTLSDLAKALDDADVIVLLVDHDDFRDIDCNVLKDKTVFDTRGIIRRK